MDLIAEIEAEIARLEEAKRLLLGNAQNSWRPRSKRVLSPEGRARIANAKKKRWAERNKLSK